MNIRRFEVLLSLAAACACTRSSPADPVATPSANVMALQQKTTNAEDPMRITSKAFEHGAEIPSAHTCDGEDRSPPLEFLDVPNAAKSLALIVDDPDAPDPRAPRTTWVHWVIYNLPGTAKGLGEAVTSFPVGTLHGRNDWKRTGYGGPCPPIGRHRYFHKLYALDTILPDLREPTKAALERAMAGHVLAKAELVGTYEKRK